MTTGPIPSQATSGGALRRRLHDGGDSGILAVVFSQVRVPEGKFGLERLFATTRHACLFLNQPENAWYRGCEAEIDSAIAEAAETTSPAEIILYGSSMGAYGAVATASRWPRARVMAFAPDFSIGEPGSQSAAAGLGPSAGEADLGELLRRRGAGAAPADIVIGLFDPYDVSVAARLARLTLPGTRLVTLLSSHELHDHLYSLNVIRKVIMTFARDLATEAARRGLLKSVDDWADYEAFAALAARFAAGLPIDVEAAGRIGLTDNPGLEFLRAEIAASEGDRSGALAILVELDRRVAEDTVLSSLTKRYLKTLPRRRIALLAAEGRMDDARAVAREAARLYPNDPDFARLGK